MTNVAEDVAPCYARITGNDVENAFLTVVAMGLIAWFCIGREGRSLGMALLEFRMDLGVISSRIWALCRG